MAYIEWTRELDTGIEVIDGQHRRIVDYINRLQEAIEGRDRRAIGALFDELFDYTVTHFTFEEELQEKAGYPFRTAHKRVHEVFIKKLEEHKARFDQGDPAVALKVSAMLRTWLVGHIKNDDADYVTAVKAVVPGEEKSGWLSKTLKRLFK